MKPYLIFSKPSYSAGWKMEDFSTREEAATRAAAKEDGEKIIAARLLNLKISLDEAPDCPIDIPPIPEVIQSAESGGPF